MGWEEFWHLGCHNTYFVHLEMVLCNCWMKFFYVALVVCLSESQVITFRETALSAFWDPASDASRSRCDRNRSKHITVDRFQMDAQQMVDG
jgi:hypothetical protein